MKLIQVSEPHGSVVRAIEWLHSLGFNPVLMASEGYNRKNLEALTPEQQRKLMEVLLSVSTVHYKRLSRASRPYVKKAEFQRWLEEQPNESLARALSTLSTLNQSKAYLYWSRDMIEGGRGGTPK